MTSVPGEITIYARVAATAINFPDDIEMQYVCIDDQGNATGAVYSGVHLNWNEVIHRFWIDKDYADLCEQYFRDGHSAFLGNRHVTITQPE